MKNTLIVIGMIILFLILYFLQINFFNWFTIAGISPNLFVIFILFISLFAGKRVGISLGVVVGLCLDFFLSKKVGISGIMLGVIGALGGFLDKNFSKDSRITIILMTAVSTFIYELGSYLLNYFILSTLIEVIPFLRIVLIEILYNVLLVIIFYPLLQKAGYFIEEVFREKKILTRYF
jgi:rod shape-determining protein MreD